MAALVVPLFAVPAAAAPTPPPPPGSAPAAQQDYVVRFREEAAGPRASATGTPPSVGGRAAVEARLAGRVQRRLSVFPGAVVRLTPAERDRLAAEASVASVTAATPVRAAGTQIDPPWGLDRIDQAPLPLSGGYTYRQSGKGVTAYVVDSGINAGLAEFSGRVSGGTSFVADGRGTSDCSGHGTHVAGTIGGTTYGVAKRVTLVPVRVLDCEGNGTSIDVVAALDWVARTHRAGEPAVVNLSLSGGYDEAENEAVRQLAAEGVTVVAAAGNDAMDACAASPASAPRALTVAATDVHDQRASFSNHGRCVDLYAPGVKVPSVGGTGVGASTMSGTSMAAPHVAGVAALLLEKHPRWSAAKVASRVLRLSVPGIVRGSPQGTPNRLLSIAPTADGVTPGAGTAAGGTTVVVTGSRFIGVTRVLFDGVPGTRLRVRSAGELRVRTPAHANAGASVVVVTELSTSDAELLYEFQRRPVVASVSPAAGSSRGGTEVTIRGSGFTDVLGVRFGGVPATDFTVVSASELRATTPAMAAGTVDVRVVRTGVTSARRRADRFSFGRPPVLTAVSPATGHTVGGARVALTGSGFHGVSAVRFGRAEATVVSRTPTRLVVLVPAHPVGTVDVRVTGAYGTSAPAATARYTFV